MKILRNGHALSLFDVYMTCQYSVTAAPQRPLRKEGTQIFGLFCHLVPPVLLGDRKYSGQETDLFLRSFCQSSSPLAKKSQSKAVMRDLWMVYVYLTEKAMNG
ncbi:hypothetical protein P5673_013538 [Acropora cervicornis]|uniref:Uncharacterized protein n=1 Tax=Acropora cervicornis TaxID=6130 RepID=A0AAD9QKX6_ACRCE|nr:hypothetical protein P5673_013538 [Acropora cervicornis]